MVYLFGHRFCAWLPFSGQFGKIQIKTTKKTLPVEVCFDSNFHIIFFITLRKRSCGRVMFSQACVKNSVHSGVYPTMYWAGGVCISVCTGRVCVADTPWADTHPRQTPSSWADTPRQTPPWADTSSDGHCSGRYASYWNAFLFLQHFSGVNK